MTQLKLEIKGIAESYHCPTQLGEHPTPGVITSRQMSVVAHTVAA